MSKFSLVKGERVIVKGYGKLWKGCGKLWKRLWKVMERIKVNLQRRKELSTNIVTCTSHGSGVRYDWDALCLTSQPRNVNYQGKTVDQKLSKKLSMCCCACVW